VQNAAKTARRASRTAGRREIGATTAYTAVPLALSFGPIDEADLPAEEAEASQDPWVPGPQPDPFRPRHPAAPASKGPQAPHPLTLASEGRPDARRRRLSRSGDFDRVYREGNSSANRFLVVYSFSRREDESDDGARLGLSVGRKVGKAVTRNKVRRAVRESFWELPELIQPGRDYVIVARPGAEELLEREGQDGIRASLEELMRSAAGEERLS
jgi:ribonuclease P protein component